MKCPFDWHPARLTSTEVASSKDARELAETIGEQLRVAREERGVALREVADQTRISIHYLEAIETNDYNRLPGGIFNRSFVKAYARYVGYDEKKAIEGYTRYMRDQGDSGEEVASTPYHAKVYTDTPATRSPILTVALAIVILAILTGGALALLKWYQRRSSQSPQAHGSQMARMKRILTPDDVHHEGDSWLKARAEAQVVTGSLNVWKADYEKFVQ